MLVTHWGLSGPMILRLSAWGARHLSSACYEGRAGHRKIFITKDIFGCQACFCLNKWTLDCI